jgi:hypothetical protein
VTRFLALVLLLGACSGAATDETAADNRARPANAVAPPVAEDKSAPTENGIDVTVSADDPGLAEMSPSRRRAYEQGFRDCSAGRYNPDPYPEAYRIGCGAAQERESR